MNRLRSLLHIEQGEEAPALLLSLYLALALGSYLIVRPARDAVFLSRYSAMMLPYFYVYVAILTGFVVSGYLYISARVGLTTLITGSLVFLISNVLLLWWAAQARWSALAAVFYLWSGVFGVIVPTQVWTVANRVLDVRQAKRLFPLISSGGILGSVAGGLIANTAVKHIKTHHLLLTLIPLLFLCIVLARLLLRQYAHAKSGIQPAESLPKTKEGRRSRWKPLMQSRYLRMIVAMLTLSAVVTVIVEFQFLIVIQGSIHSLDQKTAFLAKFYALLNFLALVCQLSAGSRLAEKFGVRVTLLILPAALVFGTLLLLALPMRLWTALFLRGSDRTLRFSIDKSAVELLYLPVPERLKTEAKAIIDMMVNRLADGLGGALLVLLTSVLKRLHFAQQTNLVNLVGTGVFNLVLISVWLWVALRTRQEYVSAIKGSISERSTLPKSALRHVFDDPGSFATVRSMLAASDEEVVLYAMDLMASMGQRIPIELAAHPSPRVRLKALELAGMTVPQLLDQVRKEESSAVGAEALMQVSRLVNPSRPGSALEEYLRAPDFKVRLSALVCLARQGVDSEMLKKHLSAMAAELEEKSHRWKDFIQALGEMHSPAAVEVHMRLLTHDAAEVRRQAALSAGRAGHRELVPLLVRLLADSEVAHDARRALREYGPRIIGTLADVLKDPYEDVEIRRQIPRILAHMPHEATVGILLESLFDYDSIVADRSIRALSKLRLIDTSLLIDAEKVGTRIRDDCEKALWFRQALTSLYPEGQSTDMLARLLRDKIEEEKDHVFRLLALVLPPTTVHMAFLALGREDRLKKANVAEYLDNVLPADLKKWVLPLVEVKPETPVGKKDRREILDALLKNPELALRECVTDAIARNRWAKSAAEEQVV